MQKAYFRGLFLMYIFVKYDPYLSIFNKLAEDH